MSRRRWVQEIDENGKGHLVEVPIDFAGRRRNLPDMDALISERHYDGMQATDGTDISSRRKHREYMKRNNLTTADDFTNHWKTHHRDERLKDTKNRREQVSRAIYDLEGPT